MRVVSLSGGETAVPTLEAALDLEAPFDLCILDIQMPEMDGLEATKAIWKWESENLPTTHNLPIIAMTAHAMKGDRETCLEAGMDDYVAKPIKRELVFEMLNNWVFNRK